MRKTGIEEIAEERQKQIIKYGYTGLHHADHPEWYERDQLTYAAAALCNPDGMGCGNIEPPLNWDEERWERMMAKPYMLRVRIAAALLASELDRLKQIDMDEHLKSINSSKGQE